MYLTQQKPDTIEALLEAARVAEITCPPANANDSQLTEQMASMQTEIQRLVSRFDRCGTSPVATDRRSVSPRPRVSFGRLRLRQFLRMHPDADFEITQPTGGQDSVV